MRRRDFLKALPALPALAAIPRLPGVQIRITDIKIVRMKVVKELGSFTGVMGPWDTAIVRVGGGGFIS